MSVHELSVLDLWVSGSVEKGFVTELKPNGSLRLRVLGREKIKATRYKPKDDGVRERVAIFPTEDVNYFSYSSRLSSYTVFRLRCDQTLQRGWRFWTRNRAIKHYSKKRNLALLLPSNTLKNGPNSSPLPESPGIFLVRRSPGQEGYSQLPFRQESEDLEKWFVKLSKRRN